MQNSFRLMLLSKATKPLYFLFLITLNNTYSSEMIQKKEISSLRILATEQVTRNLKTPGTFEIPQELLNYINVSSLSLDKTVLRCLRKNLNKNLKGIFVSTPVSCTSHQKIESCEHKDAQIRPIFISNPFIRATFIDSWIFIKGDGRIKQLKNTFPILAISISSDGKYLAASATNKYTKIWDINKEISIQELTTSSNVKAIAWNPKAPLLAAYSANNHFQIWDTNTWELLITFNHGWHDQHSIQILWNEEGTILTWENTFPCFTDQGKSKSITLHKLDFTHLYEFTKASELDKTLFAIVISDDYPKVIKEFKKITIPKNWTEPVVQATHSHPLRGSTQRSPISISGFLEASRNLRKYTWPSLYYTTIGNRSNYPSNFHVTNRDPLLTAIKSKHVREIASNYLADKEHRMFCIRAGCF